MDRRTVIALVLSALVLLTYQFYMVKYYPTKELVSTENVEPGLSTIEMPREVREVYDRPEAEREEFLEEINPAIPIKDVEIETEKYVVTLSNEGGYIKTIVLKEYPHPGTNEIFKLVDIDDPTEGIFSIGELGGYDLSRIRYDTNEKGKEVVFTTQLQNGLEVTKRYIFNNSMYHMELELYIRNTSEQLLQVGYSIIAGSNVDIPTRIDRR